MNNEQAIRFARSLLDTNASDAVFEVAVEPADREQVAQALRDLGCLVKVHEHKSWLTVEQPGQTRR